MAVVTSSACNTSLSQTLSSGNDSNLRDASFSSYLNSTEESFVRKLAAGNLIPIMSTEDQRTHVGRIKEEDEEIGVFGAEKYFKGGMDEDSPRTAGMSARKYLYKNDERTDIDPKKYRTQTGTPSVQSESSSWNSQSSLLQNGVRNPSKGNTNKTRGKKILAGLGCSCSDKESVEIKEHATGEISSNKSATSNGVEGKVITTREPRKTGLDHHLADAVQVHKPRLEYKDKEEMQYCPKTEKLGAGILHSILQFQEQEEKQSRKSIDVFGSPVMGRRNKSLSIERRPTMLSWVDGTPRMEEIEFSVPSRRNYNDTDSDASSDLFEIESIAGKANPFRGRQTTDVASGCVTPTTCYAPSEASIEWSVVTASVADFSVMSDCEELRSRTMTSPRKLDVSAIPYNGKTKSNKDMQQRRRSGILLGCKSQKAVNVAEDHAYMRPNEKADVYPQTRHRSDSFIPVTRFPSEIRSVSFNSKPGQHAFAAHESLSRSQSPRIPHLSVYSVT